MIREALKPAEGILKALVIGALLWILFGIIVAAAYYNT